MATMCILPRAKNCRSCEPSLSRGCAKCGATPCLGCSFDPTRAIFGLSGSEPTRGIISAALNYYASQVMQNYRALLRATRG